jgi:lipopolysaccharide transport system permease protein
VIEKKPAWRWADLGELWRYRELLGFLTWRDIKVRYKQTVLGALWAVLQPLGLMAAFCLVIGRQVHASSAGAPYPLFVFAGLLPWTFFAGAISSAAQSIVANQNLVTKVYFPRLIIPASSVAAGLIDFCIGAGLLLAMMVWYGQPMGWSLMLAPLFSAGIVATALGVGTLLAALTVAYRDFRHAVPFLVQLGLFATPSIYAPAGAVFNPNWEAFLALNPMYGLVAGFRVAALGGELPLAALLLSGASSLVCLVLGGVYFRRVERTFADVI